MILSSLTVYVDNHINSLMRSKLLCGVNALGCYTVYDPTLIYSA